MAFVSQITLFIPQKFSLSTFKHSTHRSKIDFIPTQKKKICVCSG